MIQMTGRKWVVAAGVLSFSLVAGAGCSDTNSKVAGPGGGPSSGAAGSTSRSGGVDSGTNSFRSDDVGSGGTAQSPR